jgi:hypothetical protein
MNALKHHSARVGALGLALVTSVFAHSVAAAQGSSTGYSIGAMGGLAVPVGDLGDATSSGYTLGVTLGMHQALTPVSFRFEGSFTELPFKNNSDAKHRMYGLAVDGQYNLGVASENGGLYLIGGVGYYGWKETSTLFGDTGTTWDLGLNGGLGYYLPLSGFTMFFEGRYQHVFSSTAQGLFPITVGISF